MKTRTLPVLGMLAAVACFSASAAKIVAEHTLVDPDGLSFGQGITTYACDEKGNLVQVFASSDLVTGVITQALYRAVDKKGNVYSEGVLAEAVGMNSVQMPIGLSSGSGGFNKNWFLVKFGETRTNQFMFPTAYADHYVMYKLGKTGAQAVGSIMFIVTNGFSNVWMYKGKVVSEHGEFMGLFGGQIKFTIGQHNKLLQLNSKKPGAITTAQSYWLGKSVAFASYTGPNASTGTVKIVKP